MTEKKMDLKELKKEIEYKWREGAGGRKYAYIDARDVMDLLDDVIGADKWMSDFKEVKGNMYAGIGILCETGWVWKWDCGTESQSEGEKGESSDAFKRAGVKWGIGRFLYDLKDTTSQTRAFTPTNKQPVKDTLGNLKCEACGKDVTSKEENWSIAKYKKILCYGCQKKETEG